MCPVHVAQPSGIAHLRAITAPATNRRILLLGLETLDSRLAGRITRGALHEVAARTCSLADDAAATLFSPASPRVRHAIAARPPYGRALCTTFTPWSGAGRVAARVSMVATRRLQLAAEDADMPVLLLRRRRGREHDPLTEPSAL